MFNSLNYICVRQQALLSLQCNILNILDVHLGRLANRQFNDSSNYYITEYIIVASNRRAN